MSWEQRRRPKIEEIDLTDQSFQNERQQFNDGWTDQGHSQQQQQQSSQPWGQQSQSQQPFRSGSSILNQQHEQNSADTYNEILQKRGYSTVTPEDLQILRDCGRESLYTRCLPLTAALCAGLMFTAQRQQFKPKIFHYVGAVFLGYFGGKLSYRTTCENKLINSQSNSPFVNAIRKRRGILVEEFNQEASLGSMEGVAHESDWTTPNQGYSRQSQGRDEYSAQQQQSYESEQENQQSTSQPWGSYDNLRQRHRDNFKNV